MKTCSECGETKTLNEFGEVSRNLDGKNSHCKDCVNIYARKHYKTHSVQIRALASKYKRTHRDKTIARKRERYRQIHKEEIEEREKKREYANRPEAIQARLVLEKLYCQAYYQTHREEKLVYAREYYRTHRAHYKELFKKYSKDNPEKYRVATNRYRARKAKINEDFTVT